MNPLITAEQLAGYLQRDLDRYTAELAIQGASGAIRNHCGWNISRAVETLTAAGNGSACINLPTLRVNDLTEVRLDGDVIDQAYYSWGHNGILLRSDGIWPGGLRRIEVDLDHGYDPVPDDLQIVCCSIAARLYSNPEGLASKSSGDGGKTFTDALSQPAEWDSLELRLMERYRLD